MYNLEINGNNLLVTLHVNMADEVSRKQIAEQPPADNPKVNLDTTEIDEAINKTDELLLKLRSAQALIHNLSNKEF